MSIGGSKKPKPTPVSKGEKIQTQLARDQHAHYMQNFAPLESQFRDEATRDYSARFAGQSANAAMRNLTPSMAAIGQTGAMVDTGELAGSVTAGRVAGLAEGRRQRDDGSLESMNIGLGITADANKSLSDAGRLQTNAAIDRTQEQVSKMQAKAEVRNAAIGAVAAVGGAYGMNKYMGSTAAKAATQDKANLTATKQTAALSAGTAYEHPAFRVQAMSNYRR